MSIDQEMEEILQLFFEESLRAWIPWNPGS